MFSLEQGEKFTESALLDMANMLLDPHQMGRIALCVSGMSTP